jgi:hypothetical protein
MSETTIKQPSSPTPPQTEDASWKNNVIPGCYVIWFIPRADLTVFCEVLPSGPALPINRRAVWAYTRRIPQGRLTTMDTAEMAMLLSREQFDAARRLGWPGNEYGLNHIFNIPAN